MPEAPFPGETLVESLRHRAETRPDAIHLRLLERDQPLEPISFAELLEGAEAVARALVAHGVEPRQTVALMLPTGEDFFYSFTGILLAGAVPVPIYPPVKIDQIEEYAERQVGILRNGEVSALLTPKRATKLARLLRPMVPSLRLILRPGQLRREGAAEAAGATLPDPPGADDLGLIQYTSGSTGDPKGVALSHANLISNIRSIGEAARIDGDSVAVSWLPLYHDMGLIGCWMTALCHGIELVCFSPLEFLRQPRRWLQAMTDYDGTHSPAPNFAYELCLRRVRERDLDGLDLSSWRMALNGAEPVNPDTLDRFIERFGECGFRPGTMAPVYGLAENAVAVAFPPLGRPPRIDVIDRETFQRHGRAEPRRDGDPSQLLRTVSVGSAIPRNRIRVVDEDDREVGERRLGHVQFQGPSATVGYYRNPEATDAIRTDDGWTRTGDRGYLADGELFITGRLKDLIIKAGRNLDPAEVEVAAAGVDGIRRGCVVAFGVANPTTGSEDLVVVAETRSTDVEARRRMAGEVKRAVRQAVRVTPDQVQLVPPRTVPKTPSGKLRRAETQERYLSGVLTQRRKPVWLQVAGLAAGAAWLGAVALLWRGRSQQE